MKIIDKIININSEDSFSSKENLAVFKKASKNFDFYFDNLSFATFDIETTGLNAATSYVILTGFAIPINDEEIRLVQYFADDIKEESLIIDKTIELLNSLDAVITFNGARFDLPFMKKRASLYSSTIPEHIYNLDIYQIVRNYSDLKNCLPDLKQKTVENFLGFKESRLDEISGRESVEQYFNYTRTKSEELLRTILLHNSDDVIQLYSLCKYMYPVNFHRVMSIKGFPCESLSTSMIDETHKTRFHIINIKMQKSELLIDGKIFNSNANFEEFSDNEGLYYKFNSTDFTVKISLEYDKGVIFRDVSKFKSNLQLKEILDSLEILKENYVVLFSNNIVHHFSITCLAKIIVNEITNRWL